MSQTSREQFEAWVKVRAVGTPAGYHPRLLKLCPLDENKYAISWVDASWEGWQASREALLIELPDIKNTFYPNTTERARAEEAVWWCKRKIEAEGVRTVQP